MAEKANNQVKEVKETPVKAVKTREERLRDKILNPESSFYIREAYKTLRTNITFSMPHDGCKKFLVTSSLAAEGKSTNSINIAITFAETGAKVCAVDCDLRRPNIHRLFDENAAPGMSNYLVGMSGINDIVRHSKYPNLDYICAGDIPPNPAELLGSEKFIQLISELEKEYEYIIIDTCPVNIVTDTAILVKVVPEVIMVALQNSTEKDALRDAVNQLEFAGAKIIGFILNGVEYTYKGGYKYRYGRKYYKAGGRYGRKSKYYSRSGYTGYGYGGYGYGYDYAYGYGYGHKKKKDAQKEKETK